MNEKIWHELTSAIARNEKETLYNTALTVLQAKFVATVNPAQETIRRELKHARKVKAIYREGRELPTQEWIRSKQAMCAIHGHVHGKNGMACYYCGYDF